MAAVITEGKIPAKLLEKPNFARIVPKTKHLQLPAEQIPAKTLDKTALTEFSDIQKGCLAGACGNEQVHFVK
ncbi:MAG: hypothetical protein ACI4JZ_06315 [Oscillospiraceae bacterium]